MSSLTTTPTDHARRAGPREWTGLVVLTLPVLLISIDSTALGFAVPSLSEDLAPSAGQLLWIVDVYGFVLAGLLITMGALGDRVGRRRLLLIGSVGFGIASLLAAYAPSAPMLIAARALLGLAGATLMPSTMSLLRNMFPHERQRLLAVAIWASAFSAGSAIGPILGGWLLEHYWWGSVFLLGIPVMLVTLVAVPLLVPESSDPNPGRLDPTSVALSMASMFPAVYGVKTLAEHGPDLISIGTIALGVLFGVLFVRRQRRSSNPLIDLRLFSNRVFSVAISTNLTIVFVLTASLFFLTQYLQLVLDISPLRAGFVLLPGLIFSVVTGLIAVGLARRLGIGTIIAGGLSVVAVGMLLLTRAPVGDGSALVVVIFGLIGIGIGLVETVTNGAVLTAAPPERAGAASAISETAYELGSALGVALLGSLLTAVYRVRLEGIPGIPPEARQTLGGAGGATEGLPAEVARRVLEPAKEAFTAGLHLTSALTTVLLIGLAVLAGRLLRHRAPDGQRTD